MKSNLLRIFFEWALITSVLMSVGFCIWYLVASRQLRSSVSQRDNLRAHYEGEHNFLLALGNETEAYARTNVDMRRFLASLKQPTPAPAAPARPATR